MGGSLVFVFLTWHIPSVAGSMMAGAVSLSLADAVYPAIWGSRAAGAGVIAASAVGGAAVAAGRWGIDRLRIHTSLHTANGGLSAAQSSGTTATAPPLSDTGEPWGPRRTEASPKSAASAGSPRDPESSNSDQRTTAKGKEAGSTTDEDRAG
jgi:hypothetical protein